MKTSGPICRPSNPSSPSSLTLDPFPPVTKALPLPVRDLALRAIQGLPNMHTKIRAVRHLEDTAGLQLESVRWSNDIQQLHNQGAYLDAAILLETAIRSLLDIPPRLSDWEIVE
jgi:hypothetical protein